MKSNTVNPTYVTRAGWLLLLAPTVLFIIDQLTAILLFDGYTVALIFSVIGGILIALGEWQKGKGYGRIISAIIGAGLIVAFQIITIILVVLN